jgi:acyl phosphate:glycerol-3-phosphate acyltransferase
MKRVRKCRAAMSFNAIGPDVMRLGGALLIGSVPVANIISRVTTGQDLRWVGTGTVSSSGLYQVGGFGPFMAACLLDIGKGAIVAELVRCRPTAVVAAAGGLAVAGHNWSLFQAGAGGRGVLPSTGVLLVAAPPGAALVTGAIAAGYVVGDTAPACFAAQLLLVPVLAAFRGRGSAALGLAMVAPMLVKRLMGNKPLMPVPPRQNYLTRLVYDRDMRLHTEER